MTAGAEETDHLNHSSSSQASVGVASALLHMQVSDWGGVGGGARRTHSMNGYTREIYLCDVTYPDQRRGRCSTTWDIATCRLFMTYSRTDSYVRHDLCAYVSLRIQMCDTSTQGPILNLLKVVGVLFMYEKTRSWVWHDSFIVPQGPRLDFMEGTSISTSMTWLIHIECVVRICVWCTWLMHICVWCTWLVHICVWCTWLVHICAWCTWLIHICAWCTCNMTHVTRAPRTHMSEQDARVTWLIYTLAIHVWHDSSVYVWFMRGMTHLYAFDSHVTWHIYTCMIQACHDSFICVIHSL